MSADLIPKVTPPNCPHCKKPLDAIEKFNWGGSTVGDHWIVLAVFCPHEECRSVLHMAIVPVAVVEPSQEETPPGKPRIVA